MLPAPLVLLVSAIALSAEAASHPIRQRSIFEDLALAPPQPRGRPTPAARRAARDGSTLRCETRYTYSLCDDGVCHFAGSVASGTACLDGVITWDLLLSTDSSTTNIMPSDEDAAPPPGSGANGTGDVTDDEPWIGEL